MHTNHHRPELLEIEQSIAALVKSNVPQQAEAAMQLERHFKEDVLMLERYGRLDENDIPLTIVFYKNYIETVRGLG